MTKHDKNTNGGKKTIKNYKSKGNTWKYGEVSAWMTAFKNLYAGKTYKALRNLFKGRR